MRCVDGFVLFNENRSCIEIETGVHYLIFNG